MRALEQIDQLIRDFEEFVRVMNRLGDYSKTVENMHYNARPLQLLESMLFIKREVKREVEQIYADAQLGAALRRLLLETKEVRP